MTTYTWNIIFMGMDVSFQDTESNQFLSKTIQIGVKKFRKDVADSTFSDNLKITVFQFKNFGQKGTAIVHKNVDANGKNNLLPAHLIDDFDCLNEDSYVAFFKQAFKLDNPKKDPTQKYIFIFLAHSFGAGFFYKKKEHGNGFEYFTTVQLNNALKKGIGEKNKIDCIIALNCSLQSVETNMIFSDTTNYLISSQMPLEIRELSYQKLLSNLIYKADVPGEKNVGISEEIIYSKFLYDCYKKYRKINQKNIQNGNEKFDAFCMSLTTPKTAEAFQQSLLKLWTVLMKDAAADPQPIGNRNIDYWAYAARFCIDPSFTQVINVIDATQFFLKLRTYFTKKVILDNIDEIIGILRNIVLLSVSSPSLCEEAIDEDNLLTMYLPYGIGIFIPKLISVNLMEILKIFQDGPTTKVAPRSTDSKGKFLSNALYLVADFQQGNIPYEERNKKLFNMFQGIDLI